MDSLGSEHRQRAEEPQPEPGCALKQSEVRVGGTRRDGRGSAAHLIGGWKTRRMQCPDNMGKRTISGVREKFYCH